MKAMAIRRVDPWAMMPSAKEGIRSERPRNGTRKPPLLLHDTAGTLTGDEGDARRAERTYGTVDGRDRYVSNHALSKLETQPDVVGVEPAIQKRENMVPGDPSYAQLTMNGTLECLLRSSR